MSEYRRYYRQQGWYFFTVVTYNREKILIQPDNLIRLRQSFVVPESRDYIRQIGEQGNLQILVE